MFSLFQKYIYYLLLIIITYPASSLFETQQQFTDPLVKSSTVPLRKMPVLLFSNVLTLSLLGTLWFGTDPYYPLNLYVHLYYLWSISIAKDPLLSEIFYFIFGLFLQRKTALIHNILFYMWSISTAKDRHFVEECSPRLWWSMPSKIAIFIWTKH